MNEITKDILIKTSMTVNLMIYYLWDNVFTITYFTLNLQLKRGRHTIERQQTDGLYNIQQC